MDRSLGIGSTRSRHNRSACICPFFASSTTFLINCSASPSSNCSANNVARFRLPTGLPDGLPLVFFWNCPLFVFNSVVLRLVIRQIRAEFLG